GPRARAPGPLSFSLPRQPRLAASPLPLSSFIRHPPLLPPISARPNPVAAVSVSAPPPGSAEPCLHLLPSFSRYPRPNPPRRRPTSSPPPHPAFPAALPPRLSLSLAVCPRPKVIPAQSSPSRAAPFFPSSSCGPPR